MIKYLSRARRVEVACSFSNLAKSESPGQLDLPPLKGRPSVVISETPRTFRHLSAEDKKQLRIFIPVPAFNDRLSLPTQQQYVPTITAQLYQLQKKLLVPQVRIVESNIQSALNKYLNLVYKDVYARYLVSKGIGVDWQGKYPHYGVMNPKDQSVSRSPYDLFIKGLEQEKIFVSKTPTLVSLNNMQQHGPDHCQIEQIKRVGHYILFPLVNYGKYRDQFEIIEAKGGKVFMIGLINQTWKSTQVAALSITYKTKYCILKKGNSNDYYVTSADHFQRARSFFSKNEFVKHSLVDGVHFEGMKALNPFGKKIPLIFQTVKRSSGSEIHPVCPSHSVEDNQIAKDFDLDVTSTVTEEGMLQLSQDQDPVCLNDKELETRMDQYLKDKGLLLEGLNDVIDDILALSPMGQLLYILPVERLFFRVSPDERASLLQGLVSQGFISESKVVLPSVEGPLKGRRRRMFEKHYAQMKGQQTDYYTIQECLKLDQIAVSTRQNQSYPVMVYLRKNKAVISPSNLTKIRQANQDNHLDLQHFTSLREPFTQQKVFYLSNQFVSASQVLNKQDTNVKSVAIEPQSSTEGLLQYCLHVIAALNLPFKFSMIKLHPTLKETVQNLNMQTLIKGAIKSDDARHYGWGYQSVRMWLAKVDSNKGDRELWENEVNLQQPNLHFLRKTFWKIVPLVNRVSPERLSQIKEQIVQIPWFDRFMLDHIDYYILHMQDAYGRLELSTVHQLTMQFFKSYVEEIYLKTTRKSLISYYKQDSRMVVLERLLQLVGVISPLLPFTAYHVSKVQMPRWPTVTNPRFDQISTYNNLISYRTKLRNKLSLNKMSECSVYVQGLESIAADQLALFLGVNEVTNTEIPKECRFSIKDGLYVTKVYDYASCYRCNPSTGNKENLCRLCMLYMEG